MDLSDKVRTINIVYFSIVLFFLCSPIFSQTTWEFSGTSYAFQKQHFDSATAVVKSKLGIQMHTFGAPYNQNDTTFMKVLNADTNYKAMFFSQVTPSSSAGFMNLSNRVFIESATGVPDSAYFMTSYLSKKGTYTDYMVMQGHPYAWTTAAKQLEFQKIVNFLISEGVKFTTAYEYWKYVTDTTIARTNKVQVILKLDDLRATTSYFLPCFQAYDFLVSKKVKAGFGVNNLWNLTQTQIDSLNYYLRQTDSTGSKLFEIWNHGLDHSMTAATIGGNWSDSTSWESGAVPTSADDAIIPAGVTVTLDSTSVPAVCNNLIINGTLVTSTANATALTVYGDVTINSGGSFTSPALTGATANIIHSLSVCGDFTNAGTFDFRMGTAGTTMRVVNTSFIGSSNSTITVGTYSSSNNDFNGITINKMGGAKVICGSDVSMDQGASTCKAQLALTSGIIETGNYTFNCLSLTSTDILTPSATSYVSGSLGRGMSNSQGVTKLFPVGDAQGYRPVTIKSTTSGVASSHYAAIRCIHANANTGSSTYQNGIDSISQVRYYSLLYNKGISTGADTMTFSQISPSYGLDDGVITGSTNLRVAYSLANRATWIGIGQTTPHTGAPVIAPTTITPDAFSTPITLKSGGSSLFFALAKTAGVTATGKK